jgi:hypothetical protein
MIHDGNGLDLFVAGKGLFREFNGHGARRRATLWLSDGLPTHWTCWLDAQATFNAMSVEHVVASLDHFEATMAVAERVKTNGTFSIH